MSFVIRLGNADYSPPAPRPIFKAAGEPALWEFKCGWCGGLFDKAAVLVSHVCKERDRARS